MSDGLSRVLIWGGGISLIHTIVNVILWLTAGSMAFAISCYGGLLITMPLCFWGGRKIRERGYVISKKLV